MLNRIKANLTIKLFAITTLIILVSCTLTFLFIAWRMPTSFTNIINGDTLRRTQEVADMISAMDYESGLELLQSLAAETRTHIQLTDSSFIVVAQYNYQPESVYTGIFVTVTEDTQPILDAESRPAYTIDTKSAYYNSYEIRFSGQPEAYHLVVASSAYEVNQAMEALASIFPYLLLSIILISLLGGLMYHAYITRPLVRLSKASQTLAALNFTGQYDTRRTDELGVLAHSLNDLSHALDTALCELRAANAALEDDITREREQEKRRNLFFAAVSHELKTPVTILRGQLEGMLENIPPYTDRDMYLARTLQCAESLSSLVGELLQVTRIEQQGFSPEWEEVALDCLLRGLLEEYRPLMECAGLTLTAALAPCAVWGDQTMLRRALGNVLSNAIVYTPKKGAIRLQTRQQGEDVLFTIENSPAQIPAAALPRLFDAFYRVDPSRSRDTGGSGLGLYIVRVILEAHDLSYRISNTNTGVLFELGGKLHPKNT